ncbi:gag-pol polyprotein, partial [Trifolium medium]|nr:gag-pol polyprotein [Trifolium medium]
MSNQMVESCISEENVESDAAPSIHQASVEMDEGSEYDNTDDEVFEARQPTATKGPSTRVQKNHPHDLIIGQPDCGVTTRSREVVSNSCFVEPKNEKEALKDEFWINAMQEKLTQFERNFIDPNQPNHVYKLKKALYGLKQAPKAWYERLTEFLVSHGYRKGGNDKKLFVREQEGKLLIAQIYVDDIVFGGMTRQMVEHIVKQMQTEFEMSMVSELTYFLGLQIKQMEDTIFITQ